jgi:adenylate cyclase
VTEQPHGNNDQWRAMLLGTHPGLVWMRRVFGALPADARCKVCLAPHGGVGAPIAALLGFGRYPRNPQLCNNCLRQSEKYPGGAELEITALFADIRGSTALAETMTPAAYSAAVADYVRVATRAIRAPGGIVQKLLGDGVMALFIPGPVGGEHAAKAVVAARHIVREASVPVGVGIHTGEAWVGFVGGVEEVLDFTALGDAVNVASRLGSDAAAGEILVSAHTAADAGMETASLASRRLELRGRAEPLDVWSEQPSNASAGVP